MIFIDTNVLIDVVDGDRVWGDWSQEHLEAAAATDDLAINDVVYVELAIGYRDLAATLRCRPCASRDPPIGSSFGGPLGPCLRRDDNLSSNERRDRDAKMPRRNRG